MGFYPTLLVEPETIALTDTFLTRDDVPSGARRLVQEARDGVERSLRCRLKDA